MKKKLGITMEIEVESIEYKNNGFVLNLMAHADFDTIDIGVCHMSEKPSYQYNFVDYVNSCKTKDGWFSAISYRLGW